MAQADAPTGHREQSGVHRLARGHFETVSGMRPITQTAALPPEPCGRLIIEAILHFVASLYLLISYLLIQTAFQKLRVSPQTAAEHTHTPR